MLPEEFVFKVVSNYQGSKGIFSNKINAEELLPKNISALEKAQYIFYVLQLDYAMKSQILYKGALKLYSTNPKFFTPLYIRKLSDYELASLIANNLHPRYINEAIRRYKYNSEVLASDFDSDPRLIFTKSTSALEVATKVRFFRGFGPKIGNFFIRTMINTFGYSYADINEVLPPVDVHDVRIAYLMGYVHSDAMTTKNIDLVKHIWNKACITAGVSWLVFDKALWLLGSEGKPRTKEDLFALLT